MASIADSTKAEGQALFQRFTELFDSESKDEAEEVKITKEFSDFLTIATKGPKLDEGTVNFLCVQGVSGVRSFILYAMQSFEEMISPVPMVCLTEIGRNHGLRDVKIYGDYLSLHDLIDVNSTNIHFDSIDLESYQLYFRSHHRGAREALQAALALAMQSRINARQAIKAHQLSLRHFLGFSLEHMAATPNQDTRGVLQGMEEREEY